ncbi:hypothetical protein EV145_11153 [Flavobacterium sp. 245]|nr:hypothetical protein EV145_11153 [Flavobacterium sp. 245]
MRIFKIVIRIILVILILLSAFMWLVINASSHNVETEMEIAPLIFIVFFSLLYFLTKYIKQKEN